MAKRKKKRRYRKKIPLAATAGLIGAVLPLVDKAIKGDLTGAGKAAVRNFTGVKIEEGKFDPSFLWHGLLPIAIGAGISMAASKLGLNRYLQGVPFVKI